MRGSNLTKIAYLTSQALFLCATLLANPARSQSFPSFDSPSLTPSQSRQFFQEGNRQLDREIKLLNSDMEPVKIKLPQGFELPEDLEQPNSEARQQNFQPKLNLTPK